jgi:formylglycine-generating enzyme
MNHSTRSRPRCSALSIVAGVILAPAILCGTPAHVADQPSVPSVAVVYPRATGVEGSVYSLVESRLIESARCTFVERECIRRVMAEHRSALGGMTRGENSIALGELISADILVSFAVIHAANPDAMTELPVGFHLQVFEVGTSLTLVDTTVAMSGKPGALEAVAADVLARTIAGIAKFPAQATGMTRVAVAGVSCKTWDRAIFPQAQAYINLLESMLIESPGVALLTRSELGATLLERFIDEQPLPLGADVTVETVMGRDAEGETVLQTTVRGQTARVLPSVTFDVLGPDLVVNQAKRILEALETDPPQGYAVASLDAEAERLFIRAYVLTRKGDYEEAFRLAQAARVLDPRSFNARRLGERLYSKLVASSFKKWGQLSDAAKRTVGEEAHWYVRDYHDRLVKWYRENPSNLFSDVEFMKLGALSDGYELGPELFELRRMNLSQCPGLASAHRTKRLQVSLSYKETMESNGDPRMRHRPHGETEFGPPLLYAYMELLDDKGKLLETARTYFRQESGKYDWGSRGSMYVKGYSALFYRPPEIVVQKFSSASASDWVLLEGFLKWLQSQQDPLGDLWHSLIMDRLWDVMPADMRGGRSRQDLRDLCLVSSVGVAAGHNEDGAPDRQYREKRDTLNRCGYALWREAEDDVLQACWDKARDCDSTCKAVVAIKVLEQFRRCNKHARVEKIASEALRHIRPGENGYDKILSALVWAEKTEGATDKGHPLWDGVFLLLEEEGAKTDGKSFWQSFTRCGDFVYACDTRNSQILQVEVESGDTEVFSFAKLDLPFAKAGHWHSGVVQDAGVVCGGRFWQPLPTGLVSVDLTSGDARVYNSQNGLFGDKVTTICTVRGKLYGISRGAASADWNWRHFAGGGPFVLFELDPMTDQIRSIDGSGLGEGRLAGSTTVSIHGLLGDENRNGIWVMETWWTLGFPHFYDLVAEEWTRIRMNAFGWRLKTCGAALTPQPEGMLFGPYLYQPDRDEISYLPSFNWRPDASVVPPKIDLHLPMAHWRGGVWGKSRDGRLARISDDGRHTERGSVFIGDGYQIAQILPASSNLAVVALNSERTKIQVWRIDPLRDADTHAEKPRTGDVGLKSDLQKGRATGTDKEGVRAGPPLAELSLPDLMAIENGRPVTLDGLAPGSREAHARQQAYGETAGLPTEVVNDVGIRFQLVPPGEFTMGSPRSFSYYAMSRSSERDVELTKPIYVSRTEITQGQWETVMGTNPVRLGPRGEDLPVEEVSWYDCQEFLRRLCELEGVAAGSYRMLSESEWEYACRAGTDTLYCFGDQITRDQANLRKPHGIYPDILEPRAEGGEPFLPVASFAPNAWGLYDMHGSVEEWCEDKYWWTYGSEAATNPVQLAKGWRRVTRGGSRYSEELKCSSFFCDYARIPAEVGARGFGLRIARDLRGRESENTTKEPEQ